MRSNRRITVFIAILTAIVVLAISFACIFCVLTVCGFDFSRFMFVPEAPAEGTQVSVRVLSDSEKVESTILASGIAMIGVAIAVWSGLNIVNAISKKDLENTFEQVEPLKNDITNLQNVAEDLFLQELLKTGREDILSKYFYERFSERTDDLPGDLTFSLLGIEQLFNQIFVLHNCGDDNRLIENANNMLHQISLCQKNLDRDGCGRNKEMKELLCFYLYDRKAECYFYQGYVEPKYFGDALDIYYTIFKKFGYEELLDIPKTKAVRSLAESDSGKRIRMIYFANTVGECYSKFLHRYHNGRIHLTPKQLAEVVFVLRLDEIRASR